MSDKLLGLNIMVAADEHEELKRCLESCKGGLFDEIAILVNYKKDAGEAEKVIQVAKEYSDTYDVVPWTNHFGDMRNRSFSLSTTRYILWLDADDIIKPADYRKILEFKSRLHNFDIVLIDYVYFHDDSDKPVVVLPRERIVKNCDSIKWYDPIHEYMNIDVNLRIHRINARIDHYRTKPFDPERNIKLLSEEYKRPDCSCRLKFYYGKELADLGRWGEALPVLEEYIKQGEGFHDNLTVACIKVSRYYMHYRKFNEAKAYSFKGIAFNSVYAEHYVCLGDISYEQGDIENAIKYYQEALTKELVGGMSQMVDYYEYIPSYRLAAIYMGYGMVEEAKDYIERAVRCHPNDKRALDLKVNIDSQLQKVRAGAVLKGEGKDGIKKFLKEKGFTFEILRNNVDYADIRISKSRDIDVVYFLPYILKADPATRIRRLNIESYLSKSCKTKIITNYYDKEIFDIRNNVGDSNIAVFTQCTDKDFEIMKYLKSVGVKIVLDKCEAVFDDYVDRFMSDTDVVVCCSTKLEEFVNERGYENTCVIKDAIEDTGMVKLYGKESKGKLKALYMGMGGNSFLASEVLKPYIEKAGYELVVITEWDSATKKWSLDEWPKDMIDCDVVLCPQRTEIQPAKSNVKVTQAMGMGMPVIASRIKAYEEVICNGENGYICDTNEQWYAALLGLKDSRKRKSISEKARGSIKNYSVGTIADEWEGLFKDLLSGKIERKKAEKNPGIKPRKLVDLIITNYNNVEYLKLLVNSILLNTKHPYNIIISDAGSDQETWDYLNTLKGITVLGKQGVRKSFSETCNAGIKISRTEFFAIMNSDMVVSKNWLSNLMGKMESVDRLAACGVLSNCDRGWLHGNPNDPSRPHYLMKLERSNIELVPGMKYGTISPVIDELYSFMDKSNQTHKGEYIPQDWVAAYCTLFARSAINQVGLFDPIYKNGCEDLDLCRRLNKFDFAIGQSIDSFVFHFGGISRGAYQEEDREGYDKEDVKNHLKFKQKWSKEKVVIWTGPAWEPWDKKKVDEGMAGSETWATYLAEEFVIRGYDVTIYNDLDKHACEINEPVIRGGNNLGAVKYRDHTKLLEDVSYTYIDYFIASRSCEPIKQNIHAVKNYVMIHDIWLSVDPSYDLYSWRVDKFAYLSDWHRDFLIQHHRMPKDKMFLTANGIIEDLYKDVDEYEKKNQSIYSSSPDRGLYQLLKQVFPKIREQVPDFKLYVAYGFFNWETASKSRNDVKSLELIKKIKDLLDQPGVEYIDRISKKELAEYQKSSKIWVYPTWFAETFCIGSAENGFSKNALVSTDVAGLSTTARNAGILIPPRGLTRDDLYPEDYVNECVKHSVKLLKDEEYRKVWAEKAYGKMIEYSWSKIADGWVKEFKAGEAE